MKVVVFDDDGTELGEYKVCEESIFTHWFQHGISAISDFLMKGLVDKNYKMVLKFKRYAEVLGCFKPMGVYGGGTGIEMGWYKHLGCNTVDNCGICGPIPEGVEIVSTRK